MLIRFNFKNFKSFRDENSLDLRAVLNDDYANKSFLCGKNELLPLCAVYGANASGKSNAIEAFKYMHDYLAQSINFKQDSLSLISGFYDFNYAAKPFLFDSTSEHIPSEFEVYYSNNDNPDKIYNYGFSIKNTEISEEWLNCKMSGSEDFTVLFYRNNNTGELDLAQIDEKYHSNLKISLRNETLILTLGSLLNIPVLEDAYRWFQNTGIWNAENMSYKNTVSFIGDKLKKGDNVFIEDMTSFIQSFDNSVKAFRIDNIKPDDQNVVAVHKMTDSEEYYNIPVQNESEGTLKMLSLFPGIYYILKNGGVLFVDELNSKLHPLLVRHILIMFSNENINRNHAQLIFTTHDAWQLNDDILRKDEIWFTEKDHSGVSSLYSLNEFIEDKTEVNYADNYLLGEYGAIPDLLNIKGFKGI